MDEDSACLQCGSTTFFIEGGQTFCENGHDQRRGLTTGDDDLDFAPRRAVTQKKREKVKIKVYKAYRGARAYRQFIYAWQFILWKQCYILINKKGLPSELWAVVRDLWMLRLSQIEKRLTDDPPSEPGATSEGESDTSRHYRTSGTETETATNTDTEGKSRAKLINRPRWRDDSLLLVETIILNYVGALLLQYPLSLATLHGWIRDQSIPLIRAIKHVPEDVKDRLPGTYWSVFDKFIDITPDALQYEILRAVTRYGRSFGMIVPPLNYRLLLISHIRSLTIPLEVFIVIPKLKEMTRLTFSYPPEPPKQSKSVKFPEAQLMSLLVIAVKMLFPFDSNDVKRHPKSIDEPAVLRMDWQAWMDAKVQADSAQYLDKYDGGKSLKEGEEVKVKDNDIMNMTEAQLDQYMHWYQRTWIKQKPRLDNLMQQILDMFPLRPEEDELPFSHRDTTNGHSSNQETPEEQDLRLQTRVQKVLTALQYQEPFPEDGINILRPGTQYQRFQSVKKLSKDKSALSFYQEAADLACLTLETLVFTVWRIEIIVIKWQNAKHRAEVFGEEINLEAESGKFKDLDLGDDSENESEGESED